MDGSWRILLTARWNQWHVAKQLPDYFFNFFSERRKFEEEMSSSSVWYPATTLRRWFKVLLCDVHLIDVQVNHQHYGACPQVQYSCVYYLLLCDEDKSQTISSQDLKAARHFGLGCAQILWRLVAELLICCSSPNKYARCILSITQKFVGHIFANTYVSVLFRPMVIKKHPRTKSGLAHWTQWFFPGMVANAIYR